MIWNSINEKIPYFLGSIRQVPPIYSAIKKMGKGYMIMLEIMKMLILNLEQ